MRGREVGRRTAVRVPDEGGPDEPTASGAPVVLGEEPDRGSGQVFLADRDGELVWLRRLPAPPETATRAHALLLARRLLALEAPGLVRVLDVSCSWEGLDLVLCHEPVRRSLAALVETSLPGPCLGGPELLGLGLGLTAALASLHDAGLVHGRLGAADVLLRDDGSPVLTGHGVAAVQGSAGTPADDVADLLGLLVAVGQRASPDAEPVLQAVYELGAAADRGEGVDLDAVRVALRGCGVTPVLLGGGPFEASDATPAGRHRSSRRPRRRVLAGVLPGVVATLLLAGWVGAQSGEVTAVPELGGGTPIGARVQPPDGDRAARPAANAVDEVGAVPAGAPTAGTPTGRPSTVGQPVDWRAVVLELDQARGALLAKPDVERVSSVDAPGSSAHAADLAVVRQLLQQGAAVPDLRSDLVAVRVVRAGPRRTDLEVVDVLGPHRIVVAEGEGAGRVLEQRPGRGERRLRYVLVATDDRTVADGWRVAQVLAVTR